MEDTKTNGESVETNWIKVDGNSISDGNIKIGDTTVTTRVPNNITKGLDVNTTPVDKNIEEIEKATGVTFNKDKLLNIRRESLLDFVESELGDGELSEDEINQMVDNMLSAVQVPEVIERKEEIDDELGLSVEDLKTLYKYLSGKSNQKPAFLDRYLAGSTTKLLDFQHVMTLIRLAQIPQLAAMNAELQKRLYSPENLMKLDVKDLTAASSNISREISDILSNAVKSIELINSMGRVDSRYQALIDKLLVVPEDVLNEIEHLLENR